ncbi:S-adenosylmethionine:tRNA ribosyltransferase-isomerase [Actinomadura viridis]|uniref:S-adenosylmethionine:tRNA ribosyltransferase-isomerase n=1 Tax=Actinomadura viridis TaxID=58110 RepID=A0A931GMB0_9ACTN|nr:S-adenosylmethionine:tRNA ribosyltransferase-isomerase [Actinomadura viridis]MBG6092447.1 S-adenosylmethionine:tRNA ribosyltransferase-isomerase [Actinomadura viridis]
MNNPYPPLPAALKAHEPHDERQTRPSGRRHAWDDAGLLVGGRGTGRVSRHRFRDLPEVLRPGDLLAVNVSATLPAAVHLDKIAVHFSTPFPDGDDRTWLVELRRRTRRGTIAYYGGSPCEWIPLPGGATLTLLRRHTEHLWQARLSTGVTAYLQRHGTPIRYGPVGQDDWRVTTYQSVFADADNAGSAEAPSAARPFTTELVTRLISQGVLVAPVTLHSGVTSPEAEEPPCAERYEVPPSTAALVEHVRGRDVPGRVVALGAAVVRALETAVDAGGHVRAGRGWTEHIVTPEGGVRAVDGLLTGMRERSSSHPMMLAAIAGTELLGRLDGAMATERRLRDDPRNGLRDDLGDGLRDGLANGLQDHLRDESGDFALVLP